MTIRLRLILSIAAMLITIIAVSASGYYALSKNEAALASIYADRVIPLRDLKEIADAYAVLIVDQSHKVRAKTVAPAAAVEEIKKARTLIAAKWQTYIIRS